MFQNIVDTNAPVTIIIIITLPHITKCVHCYFVVIAEIMRHYFQAAAIGVTAEDHSLPVRFPLVVNNISVSIPDHIPILIEYAVAGITEVKIEQSIGTKSKGMDGMVVLNTANATEQQLFFICFVVAVGICKTKTFGLQETITRLPSTQMPRAALIQVSW